MFIVFLCAGIASAHENNTVSEDLSGDDFQTDNVKDLIDNCEENGAVNLEEKTYYLDNSNETHVILNKSVTIEGISDKTIIDGNNTSLFLDVNESSVTDDDDGLIIRIWPDGYEFKYLGKNVTFKNITFRDLKMTTWHEMTFENCKFINSTFTSYEYSNTFTDCVFDKSVLEIALFIGFDENLYIDHSKIIDCDFTESVITYRGLHTRNYISIVGGDQFHITNSMDLINSNFYNSNITLYRYNITANNTNFTNSKFEGRSNNISMENAEIKSPIIHMSYTIISILNSNLENPKMELYAGYFSKGCDLSINNTVINNCELETGVNYGSRMGSINIINSQISNSTFNLTYNNLLIDNSQFNESSFELFFSNANIIDSNFSNEANITDTIKTRTYKVINTLKNETVIPSLKEQQVKTNYTAKNSYLINASGKYEIKDDAINMDTTNKITVINVSNTYLFNDKLIINVKDYMGNPVSDLELFISDLNEYMYPTPSVMTDANGTAEYTLNKVGNFSLNIYYVTEGVGYNNIRYGTDLNLTVVSGINDIEISKFNFNNNIYSNIKGYLEIKAVANSSANLKDIEVEYKVYTNGKSKTYYTKTDSEGITTFKLPKTLTAGSHKIEIRIINTDVKKTQTVKIAKAKTIVKAPKVTAKVKKSKYFKVSVKNKATKKAISNVKVKIKVYTGKKYKTYTVKVNKGTAKINTKNLKVGKHKVVISSANSNYQISAKSMITIKKR